MRLLREHIPEVIGLTAILVAVIVFLPPFGKNVDRERMISGYCLSNVKQMGLALTMYSQDYDDRLPAGATWMGCINPYLKNERVFRCPALLGDDRNRFGYAFYSDLSEVNLSSVKAPANVWMVYDSTELEWNRSDSITSFPDPGRHQRFNSVGFANGHAKFLRPDAPIGRLRPAEQ